jgi:hypothetical protein
MSRAGRRRVSSVRVADRSYTVVTPARIAEGTLARVADALRWESEPVFE